MTKARRGTSCRNDSCKRSGCQHQTCSLKSSKGDVDPVAVLEPNSTFSGPVDDLVPEAQDPRGRLLGTHQVGTKAEIPDEPEIRECVLCEEGVDLFDQGEKRRVHIVVVVGEFGVKKAGINIADRNEFEGGMGWE